MKKSVIATAIGTTIREMRDNTPTNEIIEIANWIAPVLKDIHMIFQQIDDDYWLYFRKVNNRLFLGIFNGDEHIGFEALVDCQQISQNELIFKKEGNNSFVWSPNNVYLFFETILKQLV